MKIYKIMHEFDIDGGFGCSVHQESCICITTDKEAAERFVKLHDAPHIYARPYCELECGSLYVKEDETLTAEELLQRETTIVDRLKEEISWL